MNKLTTEHTFAPVLDPYYMGTTYPTVVTKDNEDGTVQGKFDLKHMNSIKKVIALTV